MNDLTLDPYDMESSQYSIQKLPQKTLITPERGSHLERFLNDGVFATLFRLNMDIDKSNNQNDMKRRRVQCSPVSCLFHINAKGDSFEGKQADNAFPNFVIDDVDTSNCILVKDSFDSIEESTQVEQCEHAIENLVQEKLMVEDLEEPKLLTILRDSSKSSQSRPKEEDKKGNSSQSRPRKEGKKKKPMQEFLRSQGENSFKRPVIPIGPMFQADLPKDPLKPLESFPSIPKKGYKKEKTPQNFLCSHVSENSLRRRVIPIGPMFQAILPKWEGPRTLKDHKNLPKWEGPPCFKTIK